MEILKKHIILETKESFMYQPSYNAVLSYGRWAGKNAWDQLQVELWPVLSVTVDGDRYYVLKQAVLEGRVVPIDSLNAGSFYRFTEEDVKSKVAIEGELLFRDSVKEYLDRLNSTTVIFPEMVGGEWSDNQDKKFKLANIKMDLEFFNIKCYCAQYWLGLDSIQVLVNFLEDPQFTEGLDFDIRFVQVGKPEFNEAGWSFKVYFDLKEA